LNHAVFRIPTGPEDDDLIILDGNSHVVGNDTRLFDLDYSVIAIVIQRLHVTNPHPSRRGLAAAPSNQALMVQVGVHPIALKNSGDRHRPPAKTSPRIQRKRPATARGGR
jgi:hypothetical protein